MTSFSLKNAIAADVFGKVAVMFGGDSAEREVSLSSGTAVLNALLRQGVNAVAFDPAAQPLTDLLTQQIDRVLIMLHGRGEKMALCRGHYNC